MIHIVKNLMKDSRALKMKKPFFGQSFIIRILGSFEEALLPLALENFRKHTSVLIQHLFSLDKMHVYAMYIFTRIHK